MLSASPCTGKSLHSLCLLITRMLTRTFSCYYDPHFTIETREVKLPGQRAQPAGRPAEI